MGATRGQSRPAFNSLMPLSCKHEIIPGRLLHVSYICLVSLHCEFCKQMLQRIELKRSPSEEVSGLEYRQRIYSWQKQDEYGSLLLHNTAIRVLLSVFTYLSCFSSQKCRKPRSLSLILTVSSWVPVFRGLFCISRLVRCLFMDACGRWWFRMPLKIIVCGAIRKLFEITRFPSDAGLYPVFFHDFHTPLRIKHFGLFCWNWDVMGESLFPNPPFVFAYTSRWGVDVPAYYALLQRVE